MSQLKVNTINAATSGQAVAVDVQNPRSFRNLIINGAMQVAQRGTSSTSGGFQTVDRFQNSRGGMDEAITQAQHALTSSDTGPWEKGFRKSFHITNGDQTSGAGAADFAQIIYKLEAQDVANSGWDYTSTSSYITLSFWVKSSVAQTYYVRLNAEDASKAYSFAISVTTSWQKITKSIPGNSNLVFNDDNGCGIALYFIPFYGTNYTTSGHTNDSWITDSASDQVTDMTSTWWTTNDATFEITGVQLEVGDVATDFEHRSYGDELARCQRYYCLVESAAGVCANTNLAYLSVNFPVEMNHAPDTGQTGTIAVNDGATNSTQSSTGLTAYNTGTRGVFVQVNNLSGLGQYRGALLRFPDTNGLTFDAEL